MKILVIGGKDRAPALFLIFAYSKRTGQSTHAFSFLCLFQANRAEHPRFSIFFVTEHPLSLRAPYLTIGPEMTSHFQTYSGVTNKM